MVVNKRVGRWGKLRQTQLRRRSVLGKMIISLEWVFAVRDRIKMTEVGVGSPRKFFFFFGSKCGNNIFATKSTVFKNFAIKVTQFFNLL